MSRASLMWTDLDRAVREHRDSVRGMALHYLLLHSLVLGLEARRTLEFGSGASTTIFLLAHRVTDGMHRSISMESRDEIDGGISAASSRSNWQHYQGLSSDMLPRVLADKELLFDAEPYELVLHDGSHAADVVESDLRTILPHVGRYGLVLVHDTQHSYVGPEMQQAVRHILRDFDVSHVTLPFGFGLTILRVESAICGQILLTWTKTGSKHGTIPCRMDDL